MKITAQLKVLLLLIMSIIPMTLYAQGMSVFGGGQKGTQCFENARLAQTLEYLSGLVEPCDYALSNVSLSPADKAATYANRGIILAADNQLEAALEDYQKALAIRPQVGEIYVNRGNVFFFEKDYDKAIADYSKAIALNVDQIHIAYLDKGLALEKKGEFSLAADNYRMALSVNAQWALAEDMLTRVLNKQSSSQ